MTNRIPHKTSTRASVFVCVYHITHVRHVRIMFNVRVNMICLNCGHEPCDDCIMSSSSRRNTSALSYVITTQTPCTHNRHTETMAAVDIVTRPASPVGCRANSLLPHPTLPPCHHTHLHIDIWPQFVQLGLGAVVQELIGIGHVVHIDADYRLDRRL